MKQETKAAAAATKPRAATRPPAARGDGHDEAIRRTAYSLYESRGRADGHELEDWLQAEMLVAQETGGPAVAQPTAPARKRAPAKPRKP